MANAEEDGWALEDVANKNNKSGKGLSWSLVMKGGSITSFSNRGGGVDDTVILE